MEGKKMRIGIACDHGGYMRKQEIMPLLEDYEIIDYGCFDTTSVDYPIYAFQVGEAIQKHEIDFGLLICTTGIGMSIACNKVKTVRCAKVDNVEEAYLTRAHNDSNVLALSANLDLEETKKIITIFLTQEFSNKERHIRRITLIDQYGES